MMSDLNSITGWLKPNSEPIEKYREMQKADQDLRRASKEFEGIFAKMMIKQGFKTARNLNDEEDGDHGSEQFMDMAYDQMADHIANNVGLGLGDVIYESSKQKL